MPNIATVIKDVQSLCSDILNNNKVPENIDEKFFEEFGKACANALRKQLTPRNPNYTGLRISALGKCERKLWYEKHCSDSCLKESMEPELLIKFLLGDLVEEIVLAMVKLAGHEVTDEQKEVVLETPNGNKVTGHIDCRIDGLLVDVKSASSYSFKSKFKEGNLASDDAFGYIDQLSAYAAALGDTRTGGFLAIDKQSGEACLHRASLKTPEEIQARLDFVNDVLNQPIPPARPYKDIPSGKSGNKELCVNCRYCEYKWECFPDLRAFKSSQGPKYLTKVKKEPRMIDITKQLKGRK